MKNSRRLPLIAALFVTMHLQALGDQPPRGVFPKTIEIDSVDRGEATPGQDSEPAPPVFTTLHLNGAGLCEWGIFGIDLYWAALYLEEKTGDSKTVIASEQTKSFHMHFVRSLTREQMQEAYTASIKINAGKNLARYEKRLDQFVNLLTAMNEGDDLVFVFRPGRGLQVFVRDRLRGTIEGDDFGRLFFKLYFGPNPPDENLKKGLLGQKS